MSLFKSFKTGSCQSQGAYMTGSDLKATARSDKPAKPAAEHPPLYWGPSSADYFRELRDKEVQIAFMDGKLMTGKLIGHGQFDLIICQPGGVKVLIPKHAIKWVAPANGASSKTTSLNTGTGSAPNA